MKKALSAASLMSQIKCQKAIDLYLRGQVYEWTLIVMSEY
jgi:hypothetical protein